MTMRLATRLVLAAATLSLVACAPPAPYVAPAGLTAETAAVLVGSRREVPGLLDDDVRTVVSAIDGQLTGAEASTWYAPFPVSPGAHTIQLAALQGALRGEIGVRVTLAAGRTYVARATAPAGHTVTLWLDDKASDAAVSDKLAVVMGVSRRAVPLLFH